MPHGITAQAVALLFSSAPTLNQVRHLLKPYSPKTSRQIASGWPAKNSALSLPVPDAPDTFIIVDIVNQPWPDDLGQNDHLSDIFLQWKLGHLGPATQPAALSRALTNSFLTPTQSQTVRDHKSFIRLRIVSTAPDAPLKTSTIKTPPVACWHLALLDLIAIQLLTLPGGLACFNPPGAIILSPAHLTHFTKQAQDLDLHNLFVWTNRFYYDISDQWSFLETRGNRQFQLPDLELPIAAIHRQHVPACRAFLANVTLQLISDQQAVLPGGLLPGPANLSYKTHFFPSSLTQPHRPVILLLPEGMDQLPPEFPDRP